VGKKQLTVLSFTRDPRPEYDVIERILQKRGCNLRHVVTTDYAYDDFLNRGKTEEHLFNYFTGERQQYASDWALQTKHIPLEELNYEGYSIGDILHYEKSLMDKLGDVRPLRWWYPFELKSPEDAFLKLRFYAVLLINAIEDMFKNKMPDRVVMWNGYPAKRRVISRVAQKLGIGTLYLERGFFNGTMQMDTEGVNVLSSLGRDTSPGPELSESKKNKLNSFLKDFTSGQKSVVQQQESFSGEEWRNKLGINSNARIIFLPLQVYHDTNLILFSKFSSNEELLGALMDGVRKFDDLVIVAKTHPESNANEKERLGAIMGDRGRVMEAGNVHSLIRMSDIVAVNNSTVGIEAMTYFKPVVAFGESVYSNKGIVFKVNDPAEVGSALRNALSFYGRISGKIKDNTESFLYRTVYDYLTPQIDRKDEEAEERIYRKIFPDVRNGESFTGSADINIHTGQSSENDKNQSIKGMQLKRRIQEAKRLVSEGRYREAITGFSDLLRDYNELDELYPILCDLYIETGRHDMPEEWIIKAIKYDGSFYQTFKGVASKLIMDEMFDDSMRILSALVKVHHDDPGCKPLVSAGCERNWDFNSGERQTADSLDNIRKDHINRYDYISKFIRKREKDKREIKILDMFCGNGYGSYLLARDLEKARIDAVDGSEEAIGFATSHFDSQRIRYQHGIFPSPAVLEHEYDYIVSIESIEHIDDDNSFLKFLLSKLKDEGILFLSFPNKHKLDLKRNPNPYHVRHYNREDIRGLIGNGDSNMQVIESYGQDVYDIDANGSIRGLMKENDMTLSRDYEGQFLIVVFKKAALAGVT
jgi:SAM-dependent methyltransferase